jgi:catechol 2,3-dioxygenase-like lactoylglutathione lyase family enzyme
LRKSTPIIQHVTRQIPPPALEECIEFYALLGFVAVAAPPGVEGRAAWLEAGGTQIHLMLEPDAAPAPGHIGVIADGYEDTVAALSARGHEVEPRREHWGSPRAYVKDPAGNLVELMAWGPGGRDPA